MEETAAHANTNIYLTMEVKWSKPREGLTKCNVTSFWVNATSLFGGSWILRDHDRNALLHSRDAFVATNSKMIAELKCILWAMEGLRDSHCHKVEVVSDNTLAILAVL